MKVIIIIIIISNARKRRVNPFSPRKAFIRGRLWCESHLCTFLIILLVGVEAGMLTCSTTAHLA